MKKSLAVFGAALGAGGAAVFVLSLLGRTRLWILTSSLNDNAFIVAGLFLLLALLSLREGSARHKGLSFFSRSVEGETAEEGRGRGGFPDFVVWLSAGLVLLALSLLAPALRL